MLLRFCDTAFVWIQTKEMEDWSVDDVVAFAREAGLDDEDVAVLKKQKISGKGLKLQNYEFFKDCGLPRGAISDLLLARDKFLHRMFPAIIDHVLLFAHVILFLSFLIAERRG